MKHASFLVPLSTGATAHGVEAMQKAREMLATRRAPGTWWKAEALSRIASGESRGLAAYDLASGSMEHVAEREPGSDDE